MKLDLTEKQSSWLLQQLNRRREYLIERNFKAGLKDRWAQIEVDKCERLISILDVKLSEKGPLDKFLVKRDEDKASTV